MKNISLIQIPFQAYVSIGRIQTFLLGEELDKGCVQFSDTAGNFNALSIRRVPHAEQEILSLP